MATLTVYPSQDAYMRAGTDVHYSNARDAGSADIKDAGENTILLGLSKEASSPQYRFYRGYLYFNTSALPDSDITITAATVKVYLTGVYTVHPAGVDLFLRGDDGTYPSEPTLLVGDFDREYYPSNVATAPINVVTGASGYRTWTLTDKGINLIDVTGETKFCIMTGEDIGGTVPAAQMKTEVYAVEKGGSYRPVMEITYQDNGAATTQAATNVGSSAVTGNGNVTDLGPGATAHGAIWSAGEDPVSLANAEGSTDEGVPGGTGAFTTSIAGLSAETEYYYRAYVTVTGGYSFYGAVQTFTTTADSTVPAVTTNEPTSVADTTATFNGNITEDAGHDVLEHGFIYKAGGDPGTPADPSAETSWTATDEGANSSPAEGVYTSDVTGLTENTYYYYRAYFETAEDGAVYGVPTAFKTGTASSATIYSETGDGYVDVNAETYGSRDTAQEVWDAAHDNDGSGGSAITVDVFNSTNNFNVYLSHVVPLSTYGMTIMRGFLTFDTSSIPAGATVTSATLSIYWYDDDTVSDWAIRNYGIDVRYDSGHVYPGDTTSASDYEDDLYDAHAGWLEMYSGGSRQATLHAYNDITLTAASINVAGTTRFCLMIDNDHDDNRPNTDSAEGGKFYAVEKGTVYRPKLVVNYSVPADPAVSGINIGDAWKEGELLMINATGDEWRPVTELKLNVGDVWKDLAS